MYAHLVFLDSVYSVLLMLHHKLYMIIVPQKEDKRFACIQDPAQLFSTATQSNGFTTNNIVLLAIEFVSKIFEIHIG